MVPMHPSQLGPYTISAQLGRGGMGAVYEGVDRATGRTVAVKTLAAHLGDDASLRQRFAAEIEVLKGLRHPCIVQLLAFGEDDGQPYFAMELVRGRSLEQVLRSGRRFSSRETIDVALDVARALKSAHDHGVVHRDLKPANLLFPDEPTSDACVKLADFGIARLFGAAGQTTAGMIVGTAEYMAPEQATGGPVDHRVDLYALGLVMYAMLTGRPPFHGGQVTDVLHRQRAEPAPRVSSRVANVPEQLDDLIDRLLAKDPAKRPASALAVGRLLAAIAAPPADPAPTAAFSAGLPAGGVDSFAPTRGVGDGETTPAPVEVIAAGTTGLEVNADAGTMPMPTPTQPADPASLARRVTEPAPEGDRAPARRATSFTTLEELDRAAWAEAAARRRREAWLSLAAAACMAAVVVAGGYVLLRPPTADALHARIMALASAPDADLRDARPLVDLFLARYGSDPRAVAVRAVDRTLDLDSLEKRARRRRGDDPDLHPLEREYRAAMAREDESPLTCVAALRALQALHADDAARGPREGAAPAPDDDPELWLALVERQIERLEPLAAQEREEDRARAAATLAEAAALAAEAAAATDDASRSDLLSRRRGLLAGLVEIYGPRSHVADAVAAAKALLAEP